MAPLKNLILSNLINFCFSLNIILLQIDSIIKIEQCNKFVSHTNEIIIGENSISLFTQYAITIFDLLILYKIIKKLH